MASESEDKQFAAHDKVVAVEDLPGVPAGTRGKVMLRTGFSWIRYRVHFDNGVEVPWLDFDNPALRAAFLNALRTARGLPPRSAFAPHVDDLDRLADHVEAHLDATLLEAIVGG